MIYGYARVSTEGQDLAVQLGQLEAVGCARVFSDTFSGTTTDRPQLKRLMKALAPGDLVVTPAADRLARDPTDLLVLAREMQQAGAGLRSLAEPYIDTAGDFSEVVLAILGVVAKLERRRILDRTAHGHVAAKARGVKYGPKFKLTPHQRQEALRRKAEGETIRAIAQSYNVSHSTISRLHGPPGLLARIS